VGLMMAKLYEALKSAGADDDKAVAAAEEAAALGGVLTSIDQRLAALDNRLSAIMTGIDGKLAGIESKFTVLLWAVGINAAATITMLVKHW